MTSKRKEVFEDAQSLDKFQIQRLTLTARRDVIFSRMQDLYNRSLNVADDDSERELFLYGMMSIERLHSDFNDIVEQLNIVELTLDPKYKVNYQSLNSFEDMYCRCKFIHDKFQSVSNQPETMISNVNSQLF
ncbi:hypothetical protein K1T71_014913 [Dendrolimus kikuchii]|nr:hypothetical protein K1T71_014913 [Dendrolimus kikuchii]